MLTRQLSIARIWPPARLSWRVSAVLRCAALVALCVITSATMAASRGSVAPVSPQTTTTRQPTPAPTWTLSSEAGLIFVGVRADATEVFESGIAAAHDALVASQKPFRQTQRAGWRVYRQVEAWRTGMVLYLFVIQPAVRDVNYSLSAILLEGYPADPAVQAAYVATLSGEQSLLACTVVTDFGTGTLAAGATPRASAPATATTPAAAATPATRGTPIPPSPSETAVPARAAGQPVQSAPRPVAGSPVLPVTQAPGGASTVRDTPAPNAPSSGTSVPSATRTFSGDLGLFVMNVKADKVGAFEEILGKLKLALTESKSPVVSRQAIGWRVLKQDTTAAGADVPFVFVVDPPVPDADYTVSRLLAGAFPTERQALLHSYSTSFSGGASLLNYTLIRDFSK